jgi:hypothetical protein
MKLSKNVKWNKTMHKIVSKIQSHLLKKWLNFSSNTREREMGKKPVYSVRDFHILRFEFSPHTAIIFTTLV